MDEGRPASDEAVEWRSVMIDLSGSSLADLADLADDDALSRCLRRIAEQLDHPGEPIAGFNSAL